MYLPTTLLVTFLLGSAYSQEQCSSSCAAQPVVIELSCEGNNGAPSPPAESNFPPAGGYAPAPAPAPAPSPLPAPISEEPHYTEPHPTTEVYNHNVLNDPDRHSKCLWKNNGFGTFFLNGNHSNNIYLSDFEGIHRFAPNDPYDRIQWFRDDIQKPPRNWDGSEEHLGFPLPQRGTPEYDFYLCWPLLEKTLPHGEFNIKADPDRFDNGKSCRWNEDQLDGYYINRGKAKGGFPGFYKMYRDFDPMSVVIGLEKDTPRPSQDWNGNPEFLGFPMPEKNTPLYNMLMCWPFDIRM